MPAFPAWSLSPCACWPRVRRVARGDRSPDERDGSDRRGSASWPYAARGAASSESSASTAAARASSHSPPRGCVEDRPARVRGRDPPARPARRLEVRDHRAPLRRTPHATRDHDRRRDTSAGRGPEHPRALQALPFSRLAEYPELTATRLFMELKDRGYPGGLAVFRRYIRKIRVARARKAYLRIKTEPGEQAQVDWGSFGQMRIGSTTRPLSCFAMVLSWSRAMFVDFSLEQRLDTFLRMHERTFELFGGIPVRQPQARGAAPRRLRRAVQPGAGCGACGARSARAAPRCSRRCASTRPRRRPGPRTKLRSRPRCSRRRELTLVLATTRDHSVAADGMT